jgi:Uma2 family endonuclease
MPGDFLRRTPQITMKQFHAFRDERPKEEKWELIDGVPMMMPPPTLIHQRISGNLERCLNILLATVRPEWRADREVGIWLEGDDKYNPEPDVTVIDADIEIGQIYVERFYFVADVLSQSDKPEVLDAKLAYYKNHRANLGVLFVRQDRIEATLHARSGKRWRMSLLERADRRIVVPEIGDIGCLAELYRHTPLDPDRPSKS